MHATAHRKPFLLGEHARISGGRIVQVHHNACPALAERPGPCTCAAEWRVVPEPRKAVRK